METEIKKNDLYYLSLEEQKEATKDFLTFEQQKLLLPVQQPDTEINRAYYVYKNLCTLMDKRDEYLDKFSQKAEEYEYLFNVPAAEDSKDIKINVLKSINEICHMLIELQQSTQKEIEKNNLKFQQIKNRIYKLCLELSIREGVIGVLEIANHYKKEIGLRHIEPKNARKQKAGVKGKFSTKEEFIQALKSIPKDSTGNIKSIVENNLDRRYQRYRQLVKEFNISQEELVEINPIFRR